MRVLLLSAFPAALLLLLPGASAADAGQDRIAAYRSAIERLEAERGQIAARLGSARSRSERARALDEARVALLGAIGNELIPAWFGTPWAFYGASETPGEGTIACGYFVSTVLRDAGFRIERVRLAQQASENIIRSLVPASDILRFRNRSAAEVVAAVREREGEGIFLIGLDYHVGFLLLDKGGARMCHAAFLDPIAVVCEPAETAAGMRSSYHVVGKLLTDTMVRQWIEGRTIETRLR